MFKDNSKETDSPLHFLRAYASSSWAPESTRALLLFLADMDLMAK